MNKTQVDALKVGDVVLSTDPDFVGVQSRVVRVTKHVVELEDVGGGNNETVPRERDGSLDGFQPA